MTVSARIRSIAVVILMAASALTAVPARAANVLTGSSSAQTFSFSGNGAGSVGGQTGQYSCGVNGNDSIGTTTQGAGGFSGSCNTPCGSVGVSGNYSRVANIVTVSGSLTSGCLIGRTFSGNCLFVPTSGPTVVSFALTCELNVGSLTDFIVIAGSGSISPGLTSDLPSTSFAVDSLAIAGMGTISPGLTSVTTNQTFSFSGNGGGKMGGEIGQFSCGVNGYDTIGTTTLGDGTFGGSCNTPCRTVAISGNYHRTAAIRVQLFGTVTSGCLNGHDFAGECLFLPTSGPTIISYALTCEIGFYVSA
ncbi:MAG: hypothetical protein QOG34_315 [Frankiaceae bacterium]|jgi:hypothetical protein|nr:hypothetical protein [Frankiaceae bacterium]